MYTKLYIGDVIMLSLHRYFKVNLIFIFAIFLLFASCRASYCIPNIEATFGANGESGIWFDNNYDSFSPLAQESTPGINFAGGGGTNASLAQVHEFDAAVTTSLSGGAYFLTDDAFYSVIPLDITPAYTDASPAQTGKPYIVQHYFIVNNGAAPINDIWFISYINSDLFRSNSNSYRVGALNDESVQVSKLNGTILNNLSIRQYQVDNTEIFYEGAVYKQGVLGGVERYSVMGPNTVSGGADALYGDIVDYGASNFLNPMTIYSGTQSDYTTLSEYAVAMAWNIGSLAPGQSADVAVSIATMRGTYGEIYLRNLYNMPLTVIPEPASMVLLVSGLVGFIIRRARK